MPASEFQVVFDVPNSREPDEPTWGWDIPPRALWQVSRQDLAILCECSIDTVNHWFQYAKSFLIKLYCLADKFLLILNGQSY
jgi:hypothetical protein